MEQERHKNKTLEAELASEREQLQKVRILNESYREEIEILTRRVSEAELSVKIADEQRHTEQSENKERIAELEQLLKDLKRTHADHVSFT